MDCLFCNIIKEHVKANLVWQSKDIVAFEDINPRAPTHLLIVPREHISTLNDLSQDKTALVGEMVQTAIQLAKEKGIGEKGYRLVWNVNADGGQSVYHIHLHLLGGREMKWPPG